MTLALQDVRKSFGTLSVFDQLSLTIAEGSLHGIIGPNGAGKTTFFRLLLGLLTPDSGTIVWHNQPLRPEHPYRAYVPEERGLYPHMRVRQQLRWFGRLGGLSGREAAIQADAWIDRLALGAYAHTPAADLSKGNARAKCKLR